MLGLIFRFRLLALGTLIALSSPLVGCQTVIDLSDNRVPQGLLAQTERLSGNYALVSNYILNPTQQVGTLSLAATNGRFQVSGNFSFLGQGWEFSEVSQIILDPEDRRPPGEPIRRALVIIDLTRTVPRGRVEHKSLHLRIHFDAAGNPENAHSLRYLARVGSQRSQVGGDSYWRHLRVVRN